MEENNIYLISGKNILKFIDLIDDLKDLSLAYADETGQDAFKLENNFQMLKDDILKSDIFSEIDFDDLFKKSYSMDEILDKVGLTLKGRK
jgi:hypothetical protein|tara:strand:- start:535 stop:804 length:270 start_codon:yes stop_codon:yes gene_type:complete